MVGIVLVSHCRAMAEAVRDLVFSMAQPPLAIAAGTGPKHSEIGTDAFDIQEAIQQVMSEDGVLILMDIGSALLSTETALSFLEEKERVNIRCSAGPFVEGAVAAGVTAAHGSSLEEVYREAEDALHYKIGHLRGSVGVQKPSTINNNHLPSFSARACIQNRHGLHARPLARFIREAAKYDCTIEVKNLVSNRGPVSAKSLSALASLEVLEGHEIEIIARGSQAQDAVQHLVHSIATGLGESPKSESLSVTTSIDTAPIPVCSGIAIGPLFVVHFTETKIPHYQAKDVEAEKRHLHEAIAKAKAKLAQDEALVRFSLGSEQAEIFHAQALVLDDPAILQTAEAAIKEHGKNAMQAWQAAYQSAVTTFEHFEDEYLRQRAADIEDMGRRVLEMLGAWDQQITLPSTPSIIVVNDLLPRDVDCLKKANILGVICLDGSKTSHAAILLRGLGIPTIANARSAFERTGVNAAKEEMMIAFNGDTGELWLNPDEECLRSLRELQAVRKVGAEAEARLRHAQAITSDGHPMIVLANLDKVADAKNALDQGAEGVGLFRSEFIFLERTDAPEEDEQFEAFRMLREQIGQRPVIIRTLDIGGDKKVPFLSFLQETNPFLGVRGIRLCLDHPEFFQPHLRAILRAGYEADFRIMFPMIADLQDLRDALAALEEAHHSLQQNNIPHAWPIPVGIMIEVPSAVLLSDQLAPLVDFFSIGTNDLTQYLFAADRTHPGLVRYQNTLHPAVLRMISQVVASAHRHGKYVGICGEAASDPETVKFLIGLGVDELSLAPALIPKIKQTIRTSSKHDLAALSVKAMTGSFQ